MPRAGWDPLPGQVPCMMHCCAAQLAGHTGVWLHQQLDLMDHLPVTSSTALDLLPTILPQKHNSRQIHSFHSAESHRYHQLLAGPQPLPQATHVLFYGHPGCQGTVHYL